jgi:iron complex outermembrane recepter protein
MFLTKILSTHSFHLMLITASTLALADSSEETILTPVNVKDRAETATGPVSGYVVKRASSATKTDTSLRETPQAVTVITADQITDQGAQNLQDALNYAAGVRSDAYGIDSRTDSVRVRGAYPDEYLDGLRQTFNYYTSTARMDPYTLERIEVLRGPSAMLFGQGSIAGVVNEVSKRPLSQAQHEIGVKAGSDDLKQIQTDFTGPITDDGVWLYRFVALARDAQTQVDYVDDDRMLLAPSLTWRPDEVLAVTLQLRWQNDKTGSTSQFFPWEGNVKSNPNGRIPTHRFIGEPNFDRYDSERFNAGWLLDYQINEQWSLQQNLRYTHNEVDYRSVYADSFTDSQNPFVDADHRVMQRTAWIDQPVVKMIATDQHLAGLLQTRNIEHQLLIGLDALQFHQTGKQGYDSSVDFGGHVENIDIYSPHYTGFETPALYSIDEQTERQLGLYVQDQIKINRHWIVVAGVRHDRASSEIKGTDDADNNATSKRLGFVYAANNGLSPYISYSESFTPVINDNIEGHPEPLRGKQWEVGLKYQPVEKNISLGLTLYDLREENQVIERVPPQHSIQTGETKTTGAEVEARAGFSNFEFIAHYNYTDLDDELEAVPENQVALWGKWNFSAFDVPGFSLGAGTRYMSSFRDTSAELTAGATPTTPSITLFDALLAWDSAQWRFALNANNLTDKIYYSTCLSRGDCWIGARRNIVASATYRW